MANRPRSRTGADRGRDRIEPVTARVAALGALRPAPAANDNHRPFAQRLAGFAGVAAVLALAAGAWALLRLS